MEGDLVPRAEREEGLYRAGGARVERDDPAGSRAVKEEREVNGHRERVPLGVIHPETVEVEDAARDAQIAAVFAVKERSAGVAGTEDLALARGQEVAVRRREIRGAELAALSGRSLAWEAERHEGRPPIPRPLSPDFGGK